MGELLSEPHYFLTVFLAQLENKTPTQDLELQTGLAILRTNLLMRPTILV